MHTVKFLIAVAAAAFAAAGLTGAAQRSDTNGASTSKLTTVLADLSQSIAQEQGPVTPLRAAAASARSLDALPKSVQDSMRGGLLRIDENDEVQVYILMSSLSDDDVSQLTAAGATIEIRDAARRRVQARVPVSRLQSVAQLATVDAVRLPTYARPRTGGANTEGDVILHSDAVRTDLHLDGTGVRVGVLSDGLKGVFAASCTSCAGVASGPISTGDLPASSGTRDSKGVLQFSTGGIVAKSFRANGDLEGLPPASPACGFAGAGAEGTAMLEIVHDLAPGAKLSFANADTDLEFIQAVNFLAVSNDVVLDDIGFYGEPYDGTSAVSSNTAAALNNAAYPIRAYFTAVGNDADRHYLGAYADSGIDGTTISGITTSGRLHLFQGAADTTNVLNLGSQPYNLISLPQNGEVVIFLTWDDAFGASGNNYDLYLVQQSTGRVVAKSTDVQSGRQDPVEAIDYVNTGGADAFRLVVQNVQNTAQPRRLNIFAFQPECATGGPQVLAPPRHERLNYNTATRSVSAQADAGGSPVSVISVGAVCSASAAAAGSFSSSVPDESCLDTSNRTPEFFSSRGPTLDGRIKPDITAVDGVAVTGAGGFGTTFFGTSAASPHMGAIAALVLQGAPCLLSRTTSTIDAAAARARIRNVILGHAFILSSPNPDNTFGIGRADAFAAAQAALPVRSGPASVTVEGNSPFGTSLTAAQLGFSDPNQCPVTALTWTGGCGTGPGSSMTCSFGTNSVSVSASNNGLTYSASSDMQIIVTDYSVGVSPGNAAVSAGQSARYAVTIAPQSGPFNSEITLGCGNLPPGAACSFDPPAITPGTTARQSTLTVSTTASSLAPPIGLQRERPSGLPSRPLWLTPLSPMTLMWPGVLALLWLARRANRRRAAVAVAASLVLASAAGTIVSNRLATIAPALSASTMASGIAIFPSSLDFGSQTVATTTVPKLVSVTNIGADTLNIALITATSEFSTVTSCGTTLAAGANCAIAVSFTPIAAGPRSGTLTVTDDAPGSPHAVTLVGTGVAAPAAGSGTPGGSYSVTITGTAGTLTRSAAVTLAVQ
jgi:hypothetical protein